MAQRTWNVGPCWIYKGYGSPTLVGRTFGGTRVTINDEVFEEKEDAAGNVSIGDHIIGSSAMVRAAITAATAAQLAVLFGTGVRGSTDTAAVYKNRVGTNLRANVDMFTLRPLENGAATSTVTQWIYIPSGTIRPATELDMSVGGQEAWGFEIKAHPVLATEIASGGHLYNSGSPEFQANDVLIVGKATT